MKINYIGVAGELGLNAETTGDGTVLREIKWIDPKPTSAAMNKAWIAVQNRGIQRTRDNAYPPQADYIIALAANDAAALKKYNDAVAVVDAAHPMVV